MKYNIVSLILLMLLIYDNNVVAFYSTMHIMNDTLLIDMEIKDNPIKKKQGYYFSIEMGNSICSQTNNPFNLFSTDHLLNRFNVGGRSNQYINYSSITVYGLLSYNRYNSFLYDSLQYGAYELSFGQHYHYRFKIRHGGYKRNYRFYTKISYSFFPRYLSVEPISISVRNKIRVYKKEYKVISNCHYYVSFDIYLSYFSSLNLFKTKVNNMSGFNISLQISLCKYCIYPIYF